jgi:hypothetical protein
MNEPKDPSTTVNDGAGDAEFTARAQRLLRESETDLAADRVAGLRAARQQAVAAAEQQPKQRTRRRGFANPWVWAPATAMATTVLTVSLLLSGSPESLPVLDPVELSAAQDLELLEDLEFLAWVLEEEAMDTSGENPEPVTHAG